MRNCFLYRISINIWEGFMDFSLLSLNHPWPGQTTSSRQSVCSFRDFLISSSSTITYPLSSLAHCSSIVSLFFITNCLAVMNMYPLASPLFSLSANASCTIFFAYLAHLQMHHVLSSLPFKTSFLALHLAASYSS